MKKPWDEMTVSEQMEAASYSDAEQEFSTWIEQIKQLEAEAEYWRKLKALPDGAAIRREGPRYTGDKRAGLWECGQELGCEAGVNCDGYSSTPEEALDAYYNEDNAFRKEVAERINSWNDKEE